ncbi:hypothetical protein ACWGIN_22020 [Streptomyces sp. NPDC054861]
MRTRTTQHTVMDGVYWLRGAGSPCAHCAEPLAPAEDGADGGAPTGRPGAARLRLAELFTGDAAAGLRVVMVTAASVSVVVAALLLER